MRFYNKWSRYGFRVSYDAKQTKGNYLIINQNLPIQK